MSRKGLREIEWGIAAGCDNQTCIYDNGHIAWEEFLARLKEFRTDVPGEAIDELVEKDVQHARFRPMSPSEARSWGADYGVMEALDGRGYPVTMVII